MIWMIIGLLVVLLGVETFGLRSFMQRHSELENRYNEAAKTNKELHNEIARQKEECNKSNQRVIAIETKNRELQIEVQRLEKEKQDIALKQQKQSDASDSERLRQENENLKKENMALVQTIENLKNDNAMGDDLESKIKECNRLNLQLREAEQKYHRLEKKSKQLEEQVKRNSLAGVQIQDYQIRISSLNAALQKEQQRSMMLEKNNSDLNKKFLCLRKGNDEQKQIISELNKEVEKLRTSQKMPLEEVTPPLPASVTMRSKPPIPARPTPPIPARPEMVAPLFKDGKYMEQVEQLKDVSVIQDCIRNSGFVKADRYLKYMREYIEELEEAFDDMDADEDEIATMCSSRFAKCFSRILVDKVIESAEIAIDDNDFYRDLLVSVYAYLGHNNIYSKLVEAGTVYENMPFMEVIREKTEDQSRHKRITKVNRLPFYIRYTNENGNIKEKLLSKGKCVVLTAK